MMWKLEEVMYAFSSDLKADVVSIPYIDGGFSMVIILPEKGVPFKEFEKKLSGTIWAQINADLSSKHIYIEMPSTIDIESNLAIKQQISEMEPIIFDHRRAKYNRMYEEEYYWISDVFHKAILKVDSKGTTAAAATAIVSRSVNRESLGKPWKSLICDHPFLMVLERSWQPLFIARYVT